MIRATPQTRLIFKEQILKALELRRQGKSYREIGQEMGITTSRAQRIVGKELKRIGKATEETIDEIRQMELLRLDKMLEGLSPKAEGGDEKSVDAVLRIMQRRASLLGLDAPTRAETKVISHLSDDELLLEARMMGLQVPQVLVPKIPQLEDKRDEEGEGQDGTDPDPGDI